MSPINETLRNQAKHNGVRRVVCLVTQSGLTLCDSMQLACQASLSMGVSRQEYWSGLSCHPQGDLPNPGIQPRSPALQADALTSEPPEYNVTAI